MNPGWLVAPETSMITVGVGLLGSLAIWIGAKVETRATARALAAMRISTEAALKDLADQVEKLRADSAGGSSAAPAAFVPVQGLNLTTRTKVLRMHRRGEATSSIAAALGVPQEEVELLLKLDRMLEGSVSVQ